MIRKRKRLWAMLLSAALIVTQLPAVAMAENDAPEDGSIASFEELPSGVKKQTVTVGTSLSELNLPDTVTATVYHVKEDTVIPDEDESGGTPVATSSDTEGSVSENGAGHKPNSGKTVTTVTTSREKIHVTWDSAPAYDGDTPGKYLFTADADGYILSSGAKLPQITVTVSSDTAENPAENPSTEPLPCTKTEGCTLADGHEGECVTVPPENDALVKTITGWTFVDDENLNEGELPLTSVSADNQADFDTVVSMLPTKISADIEGETESATLDITGWSCPEYIKDTDGNWPLTGDYTFTAALPEGYACDLLPKVKVLLGGGNLYANEYSGLTITGGAVTQETDGQIKLGNGDYTISGEWNGTLTGVAWNNEKTVITVPGGVTANVTFSDLTINVGSAKGACAFAVAVGGTANITLTGTNTLTSGDYRAGLEVPDGADLTIDGSGSLTATGGSSGAGIGGGSSGAGGTISIDGGTVNANGGDSGAGIGGGSSGAGGAINITGGTVKANGGYSGAGIGGGHSGAGGAINITGGAVNANGGSYGAGIGGGATGSSGDITIGGSAEVTAVGGFTDNAISGNPVSNGTIRIGDDAVVNATGGSYGAGIGGGGDSGGAGIGGGAGIEDGTSNNGRVEISGDAVVNANGGSYGAGIGGGDSGAGGAINITGGTVNATGGSGGAGIGGGLRGDGGDVAISGPDTKVTASGNNGGSDVGSGNSNSNGGSLSVKDNATLEMKGNGANAAGPEYKNCIIIDKDGKSTVYDSAGVGTSAALWDGQSDKRASDLSVQSGGVIIITGSNAGGGATLTVDVENVTVTSSGKPVSGVRLTAANGVGSLTIRDLNLTAQEWEIGLRFSSAATLTAEGTCSITGGVSDSTSGSAIYGADDLTVNVGSASLTATGGVCTSTYTGGHGVRADALTVSVGGGGSLTARGGDSGGASNGGIGFVGSSITIQNDGSLLAEGGKTGGAFSGAGIYSSSHITLSGTGTATARGAASIIVRSGLTVNDAATLTAEGSFAGVSFQEGSGYKLAGSGTLTARGMGDTGYACGIYTTGNLELAFTGSLTAHGGDGTKGHGIYVNGDLTVSAAPAPLDARPGPAAGAQAIYVYGSFITSPGLVGWPAYSVTCEAPDADSGAVPAPGSYLLCSTVTVPGNTGNLTRSGYTFSGWKSSADGNIYTKGQTFPMPAGAVTLTAQWSANSGGGSGGGSYTPAPPKDSYTVTGDSISQTVSRSDLKALADSGRSLTLSCDKASMTFDAAALKAIMAAVPATAGSITFAAAPADLGANLDAAALIGSRPAYDFTISYKDKGITVPVKVDFPAGSVAVTLSYTPAAGEVTGSLFMVYVDGSGAVTWLDKSSYDNGRVLADAPHFSTYGVAYKTSVPVFTDIAGHWAKSYIEFVAARGLLSGTGNNLFSPDATMTRGMFVTALGRLAGVNPADYQTRSFTDVKTDAYYAAYVEWAAQKNIVKGTGENLFSPDAPVTREQMAVMMVNYAGQLGYAIPTPLAEAAFADGGQISAWAAKEVTAVQRAGIVKGRDGNRFAPQENATRAEVSVVLRRFVEIVIDPATASGWVKNDSGHWLYYRNGAALTGWQTIGKLRYFFNADGVMHEGWKQDTDTNKWYYWTNAGAATGWREIDGKWYYFDENGVMAVNTKIDGYEVGPDGARKEEN